MVKHNESPIPHKRPGKFKAKPQEGPSIEVVEFGDECDVQILSTDKKHVSKKFNAHSSEMLSTAELILAVRQMWDRASHYLASSNPSEGANCSNIVSQKGNKICALVKDDVIVALDVIDSECLHVQLDSICYFPVIVKQSLECMRKTQKIHYKPFEDHFIQSFLQGDCFDSSANNCTCPKEKSPADVGIRYRLNKNGRLGQINILSENEEILSSISATENLSPCIDDRFNTNDQLFGQKSANMPSLYSDYFLPVAQNAQHRDNKSIAVSLATKSYASISESVCSNEANHKKSEVDDLVEDGTPQSEESNIQCEALVSSSLVMNKPHPLLAKPEHAVSGALSGIVVSLCLHPVDTVKTVLQSCQAGPKSLFYTGQSIITKRGLSGLYRGISSNIMTSAPISSLYTFTYESVKGFLLPSLAEEYHYVAHCTAGGCASIATSFVFTPSDHIKQQMQVNSKYRNCWNAALRIIEKGGFLSLYAGWGAVLCRNIPHSIIKFYTYESLKQKFLASEIPNSQPSTSQTLLCGGLAGSAAALFSTPFDVVKTRLQTQMPGSPRKYQSILNALQQIHRHEGAKGLYRGLIPRLVMYMSQGALFFASYEFFKSLLSLDLRRDSSEMLPYKQDTDGDTLLPV